MDLSFRSRKRSREDDDDDDEGGFGFRIEGVPADKKQRNAVRPLHLPAWLQNTDQRPTMNRAHSLPFRLDHVSHPPPALFESLDDNSTDPSSGDSPASFASPELADVEMNIDSQVSIAGSASPPSPFTQTQPRLLPHRPDKLNSPGLDAFSGRIPTPIHSNFHISQPTAPAMLSSASRSRTDSVLPHAAANLNTLARFAAPMKDIIETDYVMPSPIAESPLIEEEDDAFMDMSTGTDFASSQLSRLSVSQDGMMDLDASGGAMMWSQYSSEGGDLNRHMDRERGVLTFDVTPPTPTTPGRMGRARSGAFSASSTSVGEKGGRRVVFGYREDCEKCRMRFPGHFAHFVS